ERDEGREGGEVAGAAARDPVPEERDQEGRAERREQADPGGDDHPRSVRSLSTSRSRFRREMATIRPRPTTTSEAATAMTASAKICPAPFPWWRAKAISARFAPFSMISSERSTISGLRRRSTPSAPVANRNAETARYQETSGPLTAASPGSARARARRG